ncbi:MAG TPA: L,D-transpeptidase family protein [Thermoanaerobaculia bacterium]|nr:L,D-transpeptidase family protein [Thermoanaerobaculia bacterium]
MRLRFLSFLLILSLAACRATDETDTEAASTPAPAEDTGISVPAQDYSAYNAADVESQRLDPAWRTYAERDLQERMGSAAQPPGQQPTEQPPAETGAQPPLTSDFQAQSVPPPGPGAEGNRQTSTDSSAPGTAEAFEQISPAAFQGQPALPVPRTGGGPSALRTQVLLDRARFSPGVLDGHWGKNTEKAVFWFQYAQGLKPTGEVDQATWDALARAAGDTQPLRQVAVTAQQLQGPFTEIPQDVYQQEKLECLCYASPLEMFAENAHTTAEVLQRLNPGVDFTKLAAGTNLVVPNGPDILGEPHPASPQDGQAPAAAGQAQTPPAASATPSPGPATSPQIARLLISKKGFYLQALDPQGKILYHFPSTLGSDYDPSPSEGAYKLTNLKFDPDFFYQPELFHEVPDDNPKAHLPAGPNSPVGLVWMALSKPHYGIHGTAVPDTIGYTSSHGCIRLTNWDAVFLARHVKPGTQVVFRE